MLVYLETVSLVNIRSQPPPTSLRMNQMHVITHLIYPYIDDPNTRFLFGHACYNHIRDLPYNFLEIVCSKGYVEILEWWKNSDLKAFRTDTMDIASHQGHVSILEWWKQSGLWMKWSDWAMDKASEDGHVSVLDWWTQSGLEMKWSD